MGGFRRFATWAVSYTCASADVGVWLLGNETIVGVCARARVSFDWGFGSDGSHDSRLIFELCTYIERERERKKTRVEAKVKAQGEKAKSDSANEHKGENT